jgi:D-glycero-D-manno-heptose 1,7-bisphosphate phosphatase
MSRAVFLDRDGVLNRALVRDGRPFAPRSLDEFELLPDVARATAALVAVGFRLIVVTNQPDVATGITEQAQVEAMHARLLDELPIDDVFVCYHTDEHDCACRKPKPGMLHEAALRWGVDLSRSYLVGDRWRDIEAGRAAGCRTILIESAYRERRAEADWTAASLAEAARIICSHSSDSLQEAATR